MLHLVDKSEVFFFSKLQEFRMFSYSVEESFLGMEAGVFVVHFDVKRPVGVCADASAATKHNFLGKLSFIIAECAFHLGMERKIHFERL